ncbi:sigma factor-like helix-turn-helix DNA-binding protein, partial [Actinocrinis sp.]|uniref:sigma factor-like helix-turn-helix DNA-binding protein n=1 Tax=Actinocrinis sp. TaxID=1920516 RepID=UPI002BCDFAF9
ISLAFITALQLLPPRQRAVLVLRDVLGYRAAETAGMLETTQESVHSALKRARATVDNHLTGTGSTDVGGSRTTRQSDTAAERRLVARFTDALQRADLPALIALLATDVKLSMPPALLAYRGIQTAQSVLAAGPFRPGRAYRVIPTRANGQPAFGLYLADPHAGIHHAYCLLVITTTGDHITAITSFGTNVLRHFGLPRTLPAAN